MLQLLSDFFWFNLRDHPGREIGLGYSEKKNRWAALPVKRDSKQTRFFVPHHKPDSQAAPAAPPPSLALWTSLATVFRLRRHPADASQIYTSVGDGLRSSLHPRQSACVLCRSFITRYDLIIDGCRFENMPFGFFDFRKNASFL